MIGHESFAGDDLIESEKECLIVKVSGPYRLHDPKASEDDIRSRLFGNPQSFVDLLVDDNKVFGFGVCVIKTFSTGETCLWRNGVIIQSDYRTRGFYKTLIQKALERHRTDWTATKSRNPRVYETWLKQFGDSLLPHPERKINASAQKIGSELSGDKSPVDPLTFIIRDEYSFDQPERTDRTAEARWIEDFFASRHGPRDGSLLLAKR